MNGKHTFTRRLFAGLAAAATLLAGGVFASTANADPTIKVRSGTDGTPYAESDDWEPGPPVANHEVQLHVTKYLSNDQGSAKVTGAASDAPTSGKTAGAGVVFILQVVKPTATPSSGESEEELWSTVHADQDGTNGTTKTYVPVSNPTNPTNETRTVFYGVTDPNGKIDQWYASNPDPGSDGTLVKVTDTVPLPTKHQLYSLSEDPHTTPAGYNSAVTSVFDLPYRATNVVTKDGKSTKEDGFVYNLSVFPKNQSSSPIHKTLADINNDKSDKVAKVGDKLTYQITYLFDGIQRPTLPDNATKKEKRQPKISSILKTLVHKMASIMA